MNKRGADSMGLGMIIMIFISVLIGAIFLTTIAQEVGKTTNTVQVNNLTITAPGNGGTFNITNYRAISSLVVKNTTTGQTVLGGNYTVTNNQVLNGALVTQFTVDDAEIAGWGLNLTFVGQPLTYIPDSGGRALASLIVIMFALAILVVSMTPVLKDTFMGAFK